MQRPVFMSVNCLGSHLTSTIIVNCSALGQLRVLVGLFTLQQRFLITVVITRRYLFRRADWRRRKQNLQFLSATIKTNYLGSRVSIFWRWWGRTLYTHGKKKFQTRLSHSILKYMFSKTDL